MLRPMPFCLREFNLPMMDLNWDLSMEDDDEFLEQIGIDQLGEGESLAFLVGIYSGAHQKEICNEHLDELESLAETFGVSCAAKLACPVKKIEAATFLQKGKLEEI